MGELYRAELPAAKRTANQKPAPDIFLEAARRIGVDPKSCRACEATDLGLRATRNAGMEAVDVRQFVVKRKMC